MEYIILIVIIMISASAVIVGMKAVDRVKKRYWELYKAVVSVKEDMRLIKEDVGQIRHHVLLDILGDKLAEINKERLVDERSAEEMKQLYYALKIENLQGKKPEKESIDG